MAFMINTTTGFPNKNCCGRNVLIGDAAGFSQTVTNSGNNFIGRLSGYNTTTGTDNTGIGFTALYCNTSGFQNVAIGEEAGYYSFLGYRNISIGYQALLGSSLNCQHYDNLAIGQTALKCVTTGFQNLAIGHFALSVITSGTYNFAIGMSAGNNVITGTNNVIIGTCNSGVGFTGGQTNSISIAAGCLDGFSAPFLNITSAGVGFCTSSPAVAAQVCGSLYATCEITAYYSDHRLKENIQPIKNALAKVKTLSGVNYTPNRKAIGYGFEELKKQIGVLADEVEKVLPEVVVAAPFDKSVDKENGSISGEYYKTVKYERIAPLLIEAIKELKIKADNLKNEIKAYKKHNQK